MRRYIFYIAVSVIAFIIGVYFALDYYWQVNDGDLSVLESELFEYAWETVPKPGNEPGECEPIPLEFQKIDFRNNTYQSILGNGKFKLADGEVEREVIVDRLKVDNKPVDIKNLWRASFGGVEYQDFTDDGEIDALVEIVESQSSGSLYTAFGYKLYTISVKKPKLIWQTSTGSESSCGHKQISIVGGKIILDVFGICKKSNSSSDNYESDVYATNFTRFIYGWNGGRFIQESREVFPYPENDVYKYLYKNTLKELLNQ